MTFELSDLPYPKNALEPYISAETLEYHHGRHHAAYVKKLNELLSHSRQSKKSLDEIIKTAHPAALFNNAAQHWNHSFYWKCLAPKSGKPSGKLLHTIERSFKGLDQLREEFNEAATGHFGSGWAWLVFKNDGIKIEITHDADLPLAHGELALPCCDLWGHPYYIDYRDVRAEYLENFWKIVNWDFVVENYEQAATVHRKAG